MRGECLVDLAATVGVRDGDRAILATLLPGFLDGQEDAVALVFAGQAVHAAEGCNVANPERLLGRLARASPHRQQRRRNQKVTTR